MEADSHLLKEEGTVMRGMRSLVGGLLLLSALVSAPAADLRTWTSTSGKTIEAELHSVQGSVVVLREATGSLRRIPRSSLSAEDQRFLRSPKSRLSLAPKGPQPTRGDGGDEDGEEQVSPPPATGGRQAAPSVSGPFDPGQRETRSPRSVGGREPAAPETAPRQPAPREPVGGDFADPKPPMREEAARAPAERAPAARVLSPRRSAPPRAGGAAVIRKLPRVELDGVSFECGESEHFIGLSAGESPDGLLGNAEWVWSESAALFPDFADLWVDAEGNPLKMALFQFGSKDAYGQFCKGFAQRLTAEGKLDAAERMEVLWQHATASMMVLDPYLMQTVGATIPESIIVQRLEDQTKRERGVLSPLRTHILSQQMLLHEGEGGMRADFWLLTGYGYHMEIALCGRTETHLVDYENYKPDMGTYSRDAYGNEQVVAAPAPAGGGGGAGNVLMGRHFADGGLWVTLIKDLQKSKDKDVPKGDIQALFSLNVQNLTPEQCGYTFAFVRFLMRDDAARQTFAALIASTKNGPRNIVPADLVTAYGYEDLAAMQLAWQAYMQSGDFK